MKTTRRNNITLIILFILLCALYGYIAYSLPMPQDNDMYGHATIAKEMLTGERPYFSGPFIMYSLAILFSACSQNVYIIMGAICILLAMSTTFKFFIIRSQIDEIVNNSRISLITSLSLLFIFAIPILFIITPSDYYYIGSFAPTVWHNSTSIFLMPFAILLFRRSCKQIDTYNPKDDYLLTGLIFINIFIKPSFFMTFILAYPLVMLIKYKFSQIFWKSLIPIIIGGVLLLIQYCFIYLSTEAAEPSQYESGISFGFFTLFGTIIKLRFLPLIILSSLLFPILYTVFNYKKTAFDYKYLYAICLSFFAFIIYGFLYETGPRFLHGNFYWQIVPCTWILFFVSLIALMKDMKKEGYTFKNKILMGIYILHVISGICYILRILIIHNYY